MASKTLRALPGRLGLFLCYVAFAGFVLFPLVWIFMMSIKNFGDIIAYPPRFLFTPTLSNYAEVLFGSEAERASGQLPDLIKFLMNSVIISGGAVLLSALIGIPAAYALARRRDKTSDKLRFTFLSFRFAPELVIILPLYSTLDRMDRSLIEASLDLGAGHIATIFKVIVPIAKPGILSAIMLTFIPALGSYLTPDLLGGPDSQMIASVIERQFKRANDWPFGAALSFMLMYLTLLAMGLRAIQDRRAARARPQGDA